MISYYYGSILAKAFRAIRAVAHRSMNVWLGVQIPDPCRAGNIRLAQTVLFDPALLEAASGRQ